MRYKIYIPHHPKLHERKTYIQDSFLVNNFKNYEFYEVMNKEDITLEIDKKFFSSEASEIEDRIRHFIPASVVTQFINDGMNQAEKSLAIKHLSIYKLFLESNEDFLVVLEDDVIFVDHFISKLEAFIRLAPKDFEVLLFGAGITNKSGNFNLNMFTGEHPREISYHRIWQHVFGRGCDSYVVPRTTVQKLVEYFDSIKICAPIDWELSAVASTLNCYSTTVYLTAQGSSMGVYESSIRDRQNKYD